MDNDFRQFREGKVVRGRVVKKLDGDITVDIGYKSEGLVPREETSRYTYYETLNEGDEIDVLIKRMDSGDGSVLLSKIIADKKAVFSKVKEAFQNGTALEGKVVKAVKGGFIIDFGANVTAFLPMSHARVQPEEIVDKNIPLKIIQLDEEKRNVVVSYREYVVEHAKKETEEVKSIFPVNEKVQVTISEVKENGLEVIKDGKSGFVPANELSWKSSGNTGEEFSAGAQLEALVVTNEGGKVMLSVKRTKDNPFSSFYSQYKPGDFVKAKIKNVQQEGVIVDLGNELEGVIEKSELSYFKKITNPEELYKAGDEVEAQVVSLDPEKSRVYLSVKRLQPNPWPDMEERYPVDSRVTGGIREIVEGEGAFVELEENIEAFVHMSNITWLESFKIADVLHIGDRKEFKILGLDKSKFRILLGLKQLQQSPWMNFLNIFKEGAIVDVKIIDIEDAAVVCEITDGINGRIPIKNKMKLNNKKGDVIKARLMKIDKDTKKIVLAAKDLEMTEEKKQLDEYLKTHEHSFKMNDLMNIPEEKKGEK
jgi:small subunit ribosomal protein S1